MSRILSVLFFIFICLTSQAQVTVGSGGDYIRRAFENGRIIAAQKIESIKPCYFQPEVSEKTKDWILLQRTALINDIKRSPHIWKDEAQATCAFTLHSPEAPISLSYSTCRETTDQEASSIFTLIHESAHHLGVSDETQADQIAIAIMNSVTNKICASREEIFEQRVCTGPAAVENDFTKLFSQSSILRSERYHIYARSRICNEVGSCYEWVENTLVVDRRDSSSSNKIFSLEPEKTVSGDHEALITATGVFPYYSFDLKRSDAFNIEVFMGAALFLSVNDTQADASTFFVRNLTTGKALPILKTHQVGVADKLAFTGHVQSDCARFIASHDLPLQDGFIQKNEYVIYGEHDFAK